MLDEMLAKKGILRLKDAAKYCGISLPTLWRLEKRDPNFPKKIIITPRCCGYRKSDLDGYFDSKMEP